MGCFARPVHPWARRLGGTDPLPRPSLQRRTGGPETMVLGPPRVQLLVVDAGGSLVPRVGAVDLQLREHAAAHLPVRAEPRGHHVRTGRDVACTREPPSTSINPFCRTSSPRTCPTECLRQTNPPSPRRFTSTLMHEPFWPSSGCWRAVWRCQWHSHLKTCACVNFSVCRTRLPRTCPPRCEWRLGRSCLTMPV